MRIEGARVQDEIDMEYSKWFDYQLRSTLDGFNSYPENAGMQVRQVHWGNGQRHSMFSIC